MKIELRHIMLMVKDVQASANFYSQGLGLEIKTVGPMWAELKAGETILAMHHSPEGDKKSDSPILSFTTDNILETVAHLQSLGAQLEGEIRQPSFGKVAALRSPDGHLLSLLQPSQKTN